jgi:phosphoserine phosphatase
LNQSASSKAAEFVESVVSLRPRIACFDCDGTLWSIDAGEGFFWWELENGLVSDEIVRWAGPRYADYKAGKVEEEVMCGEMVIMHRGLPEGKVQQAAVSYFDQHLVGSIFPEMRELVKGLQEQGCEVWAISSSNEWVIRAGMRHFGIPDNRILAAAAEIEDGKVTDRLLRVPSGPGKPQAVCEAIRKDPDAAFGNSIWDADMLKMARHAFAINPTPELLEIARACGWKMYSPDSLFSG